jgi:hypothetical protein
MRTMREHLSYANIMATVAVFLALGGSAYAVSLGKNAVRSKNIAKGAVKTSDIAKGAVTAAKLHSGAIPASAIPDGSITAAKIAPDAVGAAQLGNVVARVQTLALVDNSNQVPSVSCRSGEQAIGGGERSDTVNNDITVNSSFPEQTSGGLPASDGGPLTGWDTNIDNAAGGAGTAMVSAFVICLQ